MEKQFIQFATHTAKVAGKPWTFLLCLAVVTGWAVTGPIFAFSESWQLVINTGTTIVTFLMVFLIQNTQNRESQALQVKLDELIRAVSGARNSLIDLDQLSDEELTRVQGHYAALAKKSKNELRELKDDTVTVENVAKRER